MEHPNPKRTDGHCCQCGEDLLDESVKPCCWLHVQASRYAKALVECRASPLAANYTKLCVGSVIEPRSPARAEPKPMSWQDLNDDEDRARAWVESWEVGEMFMIPFDDGTRSGPFEALEIGGTVTDHQAGRALDWSDYSVTYFADGEEYEEPLFNIERPSAAEKHEPDPAFGHVRNHNKATCRCSYCAGLRTLRQPTPFDDIRAAMAAHDPDANIVVIGSDLDPEMVAGMPGVEAVLGPDFGDPELVEQIEAERLAPAYERFSKIGVESTFGVDEMPDTEEAWNRREWERATTPPIMGFDKLPGVVRTHEPIVKLSTLQEATVRLREEQDLSTALRELLDFAVRSLEDFGAEVAYRPPEAGTIGALSVGLPQELLTDETQRRIAGLTGENALHRLALVDAREALHKPHAHWRGDSRSCDSTPCAAITKRLNGSDQ